jgi:hypothetical protein
MNRSGTSAFTRMISLAGADLPGDLVPPNESNVRGHWEPRAIVEIHHRLMERLGHLRHSDHSLPEGWLEHPATSEARTALLRQLRADFSESPAFVIKDPRLCHLLPLWRDILEEFGAAPHVIVCFRHPIEVARSLERKNEIPWGKSLTRWLNTYLEVERETRGLPRSFSSFGDLMTDWKRELRRFELDLGITWPLTPAEIEAEVESFLSPEHRHHEENSLDQVDDPVLRRHLEKLYGALLEARSSGGAPVAELDPPVMAYLAERRASPEGQALQFERERLIKLLEEHSTLKLEMKRMRERKKRIEKRYRKQRRLLAVALILIVLLATAAVGALSCPGLPDREGFRFGQTSPIDP